MGSAESIAEAYVILLSIQCVHSLEELSTGFHKKWYLFSMPFFALLCFHYQLVVLIVGNLPTGHFCQSSLIR